VTTTSYFVLAPRLVFAVTTAVGRPPDAGRAIWWRRKREEREREKERRRERCRSTSGERKWV
jgi:hypothetical protein